MPKTSLHQKPNIEILDFVGEHQVRFYAILARTGFVLEDGIDAANFWNDNRLSSGGFETM